MQLLTLTAAISILGGQAPSMDMLWALHAEEASPGHDALKEAQHQCLFLVSPTHLSGPSRGPAPLSVSQTGIMHTQPPTDGWGDRNALHSPVNRLLRASAGKVLVGIGQTSETLTAYNAARIPSKRSLLSCSLLQKEELGGVGVGRDCGPGYHEPGQPRDPDQALPPNHLCPAPRA